MPSLIVCPLSHLHETLETSGAQNVLTLMMAKGAPKLYEYGIKHQEIIEFSDISEPREGYLLAETSHVQRILENVRSWDRQQPLIIHCFAGISRSTAAAYIAACDLLPETSEETLARHLRTLSPSATPNIHLIQLADDILGRKGRMVEAIRKIGRGAEAFEGNVFHIPVTAFGNEKL